MELTIIPIIESNALDAWKYDAEAGELTLKWRGKPDMYIYTGDVAGFEADVREYRSWGRVANWYANGKFGVELKEVIRPCESYTWHENRITGETHRVFH